jgi:hypothetical protein
MSTFRKRDDLHEGYIYRVVMRPHGQEDLAWLPTAYGQSGTKPRTYMTLSAARGAKTRMEAANLRAREYSSLNQHWDFAVERSPVTAWERVDG